jgi:DNA-binding CsgD family transcriptional regulator
VGYDELTPTEWGLIAHTWAGVAASPVSELDASMGALWEGLRKLFPFDQAYVMPVYRGDAESRAERLGYFRNWIVVHAFFAPGEYRDDYEEILEEYRNFHVEDDEWVAFFEATAGTHRAFYKDDVFGEVPWSQTSHAWLFEQIGVQDRMHAAYALGDGVELFLCVDRTCDEPYTAHDRTVLFELMRGLGPFWSRIATSFGLYEHQQRLTKRQRETLFYLLGGYSEAEIAEMMGLTQGSAHQYVMAVYRALNVNSRPQLMATWMEDVPNDVPGLRATTHQ